MDGITTTPDLVENGSFDPEAIRSIIDHVPKHRSYQLTFHQGTMQITVMPEAWKGSQRSEDDPGSVDEYYFEDHDLLVLDLSR